MAETGLEVVISMNLQDVDSKTIQVLSEFLEYSFKI